MNALLYRLINRSVMNQIRELTGTTFRACKYLCFFPSFLIIEKVFAHSKSQLKLSPKKITTTRYA